ncbi:MAG: nucleotidyl transferase AbiEii/AbiGii toxin family protein [Planctomycetia bacterium]
MAGEGVFATLAAGWQALAAVDAAKAVVGGLALTAWRHARYTRDADVLVAIDHSRVTELVEALTAAGFSPRHVPPLRVIDGQGIVQFTFRPPEALLPFQFDVLLAAGDFQRAAVARAVAWPEPSGSLGIRVVRADDLVVLKLLAGRIIDRADAAMLLRENRAEIDFSRLQDEVVRQGVTREYREAWQAAFPSA